MATVNLNATFFAFKKEENGWNAHCFSHLFSFQVILFHKIIKINIQNYLLIKLKKWSDATLGTFFSEDQNIFYPKKERYEDDMCTFMVQLQVMIILQEFLPHLSFYSFHLYLKIL